MASSSPLPNAVIEEKVKIIRKWNLGLLEHLQERSHLKNLKEIKEFLELTKPMESSQVETRTMIALLGGSGHGKSSLINALVDEENVITASSMRACTTVATEISWNSSPNKEELFAAEVEFLSESEWAEEVRQCMNDIQDAINLNEKVSSETSDSYARLIAVYPNVDIKEFVYNRQDLLKTRDLSRYLGKPIRISGKSITAFRKAITGFIGGTADDEKDSQPFSPFPLIRVVRIFLRSPVLQHGLVLIDLPGMGDKNAARNQLAERYIKDANHIFVIARINRAVTDRTAHELLGEHFQKHLYHSGKYTGSFVTFVATFIDDINILETIEVIEHDKEISGELQAIIKERDSLQLILDDYKKESDALNDRVKAIAELLKPFSISKKRKRAVTDKTDASDLLDKDQEKELQDQKLQVNKEKKKLGAKVKKVEKEHKTALLKLQAICIKGRSAWTTQRLRNDFKAGLESLQNELTQASLSASIKCEKPESVSTIASDLDVFCVSSKAYQRLCGRNKWDPVIEGFSRKAETGIPGLRKYIVSLCIYRSRNAHQEVLQELEDRIDSLRLWAGDDDDNASSTEANAPEIIQSCIKDLADEARQDRGETFRQLHQIAQEKVVANIQRACDAAIKQAPRTKKDLPESSQTWKAICRRHGVFTGRKNAKKISYEWNNGYTLLITDSLSRPLVSTFLKEIPARLSAYETTLNTRISTFIESIYRASTAGKISGKCVLALKKYEGGFRKIVADVTKNVIKKCKALPDDVVTAIRIRIKKFLMPIYDGASDVQLLGKKKGPNLIERLSTALREHWTHQGPMVYQAAAKIIEREVENTLAILTSQLRKGYEELYKRVAQVMGDSIGAKIEQESVTEENSHLMGFRKALRGALTILDHYLADVEKMKIEPEPAINEHQDNEDIEKNDGGSEEEEDYEDIDDDSDDSDVDNGLDQRTNNESISSSKRVKIEEKEG